MKQCFKCKKELELEFFYKHSKMKDGCLNKCKECTKKDVKINTEKNNDYYKEYNKKRNMLPHRIEARKIYSMSQAGKLSKQKSTKKYQINNPDKRKAHIIIGNAVRDGKIKKMPCSVCGNTKVHAHHEDYSKPMDVVWLCVRCHKDVHRH